MFTVKLQLPSDVTVSVSALLELTEHSIVQREDRETGKAWLEMFFSTRDEAQAESGNLVSILELFGCEDIGQPEVVESPDRDWQDAWKEHFHAVKVSSRLTVAPTWESEPETDGEIVVRLDPGMSFGTGQHPTTQACLAFLDQLSDSGCDGSLCDVGCGSGILSIAAAKLGFSPVLAFDNDPLAVKIAKENLVLNGVNDVDVQQVDLAEASEEITSCDVVVANMLANLLDAFASSIAARLKPGAASRLILAGMMGEGQYAWTRAMFEKRGLREIEHQYDGDWVSMVLGWQTNSPSFDKANVL
ncbi:MAG: 50S ribosomal protein L11 methyltransferase [Kiritimatiellae bacterium]|nr:50S ribosomal protein L11 methyltransferase [Kiritimatiellia bacterium]